MTFPLALLREYKRVITVRNFALKFQVVAQKTAKNVRGYFFCRTLYTFLAIRENNAVAPTILGVKLLKVNATVGNATFRRTAVYSFQCQVGLYISKAIVRSIDQRRR